MTKLPRVALVTNVLPHYRVPCFEALAERLPGQVDFFVLAEILTERYFVLADAHPNLPVHVLSGKAWAHPPFDDVHLNDPRPVLRDYDLIILGGWAEPTFLLLWLLAQLRGTRVAFWIESTLYDGARDTWKESYKRLLLRRAGGAIVMGKSSAAYCEWLGLPRSRIFIAPNAGDSAYFRKQAASLLPRRAELRRALGVEGVVILFVGRMVEFYKGVSTLLSAQAELEKKNLPAQLVLIGEGADRAEYKRTSAELGLRSVRFENFMNHAALSRYYAAADIFVLPSRSETWGLVINEAMEFGLPIVTTQVVGAAADLVHPENGFVVPPGDVAALACALETLARNETRRQAMGECSRAIIAQHTPEAWAEHFARAVETMLR
ncbi:MAG TPA: glycosyltransferase family 4 protein [Anaerolineae bacterium]|nr:glycosyltransferase family 4 protein [Anaerolineae bacterium]